MSMLTLLSTAALATLPLQELPEQKLEPGHCVAFFWTRAEPPLRIARLDETAGTLRVQVNRRQQDLPRVAPNSYASGNLRIHLAINPTDGTEIAGGQIISQAAMRIEQEGADTLVIPVAGLRAC